MAERPCVGDRAEEASAGNLTKVEAGDLETVRRISADRESGRGMAENERWFERYADTFHRVWKSR